MSPVTSARVAVIQDVQTLCIHYTDCWLPPLRPPFWMAPQLSQSESEMRVSVRVCLLQALIWCYYSADGETGCGSQELLVDSTCLRPGLVTPRHTWTNRELKPIRGENSFYFLRVSPYNNILLWFLNTPLFLCYRGWLYLYLISPLQPHVPHLFFLDTAAYVNNPWFLLLGWVDRGILCVWLSKQSLPLRWGCRPSFDLKAMLFFMGSEGSITSVSRWWGQSLATALPAL